MVLSILLNFQLLLTLEREDTFLLPKNAKIA